MLNVEEDASQSGWGALPSLLGWVQEGSITSLCSPLCPPGYCTPPQGSSVWAGEVSKCSRVYLLVSSSSYVRFSGLSWKLSPGWGPPHGRSGLAWWCSGEPGARGTPTRWTALWGPPARAQPSHPAPQTQTQSPPASLGTEVFNLFKGGTLLAAGERCLTALWPVTRLKKMGCQNVPALKTQTAADAGAKMFKFPCYTSDDFHGIDRKRQKCGNCTYICLISRGVIRQQVC